MGTNQRPGLLLGDLTEARRILAVGANGLLVGDQGSRSPGGWKRGASVSGEVTGSRKAMTLSCQEGLSMLLAVRPGPSLELPPISSVVGS